MADPITEFEFGSEYIDRGPDGGLLRLIGEMDLASASEFERALLDADGQPTLVLDLRALHFIDCASLRAIFREADRYRLGGRRLVLIPGSGSVAKILRIVKAEHSVEIVDGADADRDVEDPRPPELLVEMYAKRGMGPEPHASPRGTPRDDQSSSVV